MKVKCSLIFILLLSLVCCKQQEKKRRLQLNKFTYCEYAWRLNDSTNTFEFYIDKYLDVDTNGLCRMMHHEKYWGNHPQYFKVTLNSAQLSLINSLFSNKEYKEFYLNDSLMMYDGLSYHIEYLSSENEIHKIEFLPMFAPDDILNAKSGIENIIFGYPKDTCKPFDLKEFTDSMKAYSLKGHPLPSPPKTIRIVEPIIK